MSKAAAKSRRTTAGRKSAKARKTTKVSKSAKVKEATTGKKAVSAKEAPRQRSWRVAFFLSMLLGFTGADRFYIGRTRSAIAKTLSLGGVGVWWLSDFILIASEWRKDADGQPLRH